MKNKSKKKILINDIEAVPSPGMYFRGKRIKSVTIKPLKSKAGIFEVGIE